MCLLWSGEHHHWSLCPKQFRSTHRENSSFAEKMTVLDELVYTENGLISSGEMVLISGNIKWTFTIELAPWMGGFYERLVGVVY